MISAQCKAYATVWEIIRKDKYSEVRFSTSRKDKKTDGYINSSWCFVRFVGEAHKKAVDLKERDKIIITNFSIENSPYKNDAGETRYAFKMTVWDFVKHEEDIEKDDCPF